MILLSLVFACFAVVPANLAGAAGTSNYVIYGGSYNGLPYSSLAEAFATVNADTGTTYTIRATIGDPGVVAFTLNKAKTVTLTSDTGGPFTLKSTTAGRVGTISAGTLILTNITLDGGGVGGGLDVSGSGSLTLNSAAVIQNCLGTGTGGGVNVHAGGSMTMNDGTITSNIANHDATKASTGGGVNVEAASFTMNGGTISNNKATTVGAPSSGNLYATGGGVHVSGDSGGTTSGSFTMTGGSITGNIANAVPGQAGQQSGSGNGGGVYLYGPATFTMTGGSIDNNTASASSWGPGGGVDIVNNGTFNMSGGKITQNFVSAGSSTSNGSGVNLSSSTFNLSGNAEVSFNKGNDHGGPASGAGVYGLNNSLITMTDTASIHDNSATSGTGYGGGVYLTASSLTMAKQASIYNNAASLSGSGTGGGVYATGSKITLSGAASIKNNYASQSAAGTGGGIYLTGGASLTMGQSATDTPTIQGNVSGPTGGDGGGVYLTSTASLGTLVMNEGTISSNSAPQGDGGGIYSEAYSYSDPVPAVATAYANIGIATNNTAVSANTSQMTTLPPSNAALFSSRATSPFAGSLLTNDQINYNPQYRVIYNANGGGGDDFPVTPTGPTATALSVDATGITAPAGAVFLGWNTAANGAGTAYEPHASVPLSGTITLYAQWGVPLTVSNTLTGPFADKTLGFSYTVFFEDAGGKALPGPYDYTGAATGAGVTAPVSGSLTAADGSDSFTLGSGQSLTFTTVPLGASARIVQTTDPNYLVSFTDSANTQATPTTNDTTMVALTTARSVAFTNTRVEIVPTGLSLGGLEGLALAGLVALVVIAGFGGAAAVRRIHRPGAREGQAN